MVDILEMRFGIRNSSVTGLDIQYTCFDFCKGYGRMVDVLEMH